MATAQAAKLTIWHIDHILMGTGGHSCYIGL